ncbi:MAG: nucleotide exchange factor GrpE [Sulfobacillus benefaciens]|uniref:Nucleotide exchange factor GrpE n=1 Tax=Sulfobacillus benefaciens TaxID=453960 RepID=A0A2T2XK65_9FIRM|nr:MAG: nucleotide exchange factor GrpE [Sulfobacillus benefaciens]
MIFSVQLLTMFIEEFLMWPFTRRKSFPESVTISEHQQKMFNAIEELNDQLTKFVRWSYRNQKSTLESLQNLQADWTTFRSNDEATVRELEATLEQLSRDLMGWVDDIDAVFQAAGQDNAVGDKGLMGRWLAQLIQRLHTLGYEECLVRGTLFDPRTSEALGTTGEWVDDTRQPRRYEVVSVLRRGFLRHGVLHRKAQVVVYKGEDEENSGGLTTDGY